MELPFFENENPLLYEPSEEDTTEIIDGTSIKKCLQNFSDLCDLHQEDKLIEEDEIFDMLRNIKDPEYSYTLENLKIIEKKNISINHKEKTVTVYFTPTIPNCSSATLIGLMINIKLKISLPLTYKTNIYIYPGTHSSEHSVNKQLNDKERIAAATENVHLYNIIKECIDYNCPTITF